MAKRFEIENLGFGNTLVDVTRNKTVSILNEHRSIYFDNKLSPKMPHTFFMAHPIHAYLILGRENEKNVLFVDLQLISRA